MQVLLVISLLTISAMGYPSVQEAAICDPTVCTGACRCATTSNPITTAEDPAPVLLAITVSESIVKTLYDDYLEPLLFDRYNADGNPIGVSFYVNHEYTDYPLVHDLWSRGFEIGSHSITKNSSQEYWRQASEQDLIEEFGGQRDILSYFGNIPAEDIVGARTPQLQLEGDVSIDAYVETGFTYDNSWPTLSTLPLLPYTLDYKTTQKCTVTMTCPVESHPGFWIAPIRNIRGANNVECNSLATCLVEGSAQDIADWLMREVEYVRSSNRAPLTLRLDSYWFLYTENSFEGFQLFLDAVTQLEDVFLVSVGDIVEWIKNPVPASQYTTPIKERNPDCYSPVPCTLESFDGGVRYMNSCVPCPAKYPWKGNPYGEDDS